MTDKLIRDFKEMMEARKCWQDYCKSIGQDINFDGRRKEILGIERSSQYKNLIASLDKPEAVDDECVGCVDSMERLKDPYLVGTRCEVCDKEHGDLVGPIVEEPKPDKQTLLDYVDEIGGNVDILSPRGVIQVISEYLEQEQVA